MAVKTRRLTKLKAAIALRESTQRRTAREAGMDETRLSDLINGRAEPTKDEQARLSHALQFSKAKLFGLDPLGL